MGRKKSEATGWQWGKEPKPEALAKLPVAVRDSAVKTLREKAPTIADWVVSRIRDRGMVAKFGREMPLPAYSQPYARLLQRAGYPTKPDNTLSGAMLDHLKGRAKVTKEDEVVLVINPYGTASGKEALKLPEHPRGAGPNGEERDNQYWKPPYSYTNQRSGKTVNVAGQWIKWPPRELERKRRARKARQDREAAGKKTLYNAHLATYLSYRLGYGRWQRGGKPPSSFLTLTTWETNKVYELLSKGLTAAANRCLLHVAGR